MDTKLSQDANLLWEASTFKAIWPLDHLINVRSRDNLKNLYFHFHKVYVHWTWQAADFSEEALHANALVVTDFFLYTVH